MRSRRGAAARAGDRGQASVELALLLPVVLLLVLAVVQVGLVGRDVVLVTHAARAAARAAAVDPDPGAATAAARSASGLAEDRLVVSVRDRGGPGSRVRVTVSYRIPTDVPLAGGLVGDLRVSRTVTMRVESD